MGGNDLIDGGGESDRFVVGTAGTVPSLGEEKNFRPQPSLWDVEAHDPFGEEIEPVLYGVGEHQDEVKIEAIWPHCLL